MLSQNQARTNQGRELLRTHLLLACGAVWQVDQLKSECTQRGLDTVGKKADLIARLKAHEAGAGKKAKAAAAPATDVRVSLPLFSFRSSRAFAKGNGLQCCPSLCE